MRRSAPLVILILALVGWLAVLLVAWLAINALIPGGW